MSQSLNRIRSLVSEIEQIQKQGQRISRSGPRLEPASFGTVDEPRPEAQPLPETQQDSSFAGGGSGPEAQAARVEPEHEPRLESSGGSSNLTRPELSLENRVMVQWSGNLVLELVLPQNAEKIELKQIGDWIEIRFSDGKAFHIPFKNVA